MNLFSPFQLKSMHPGRMLLCVLLAGFLLSSLSGFTYKGIDIQIQVLKKKAQTIRLSPNPSFNGTVKVVSESKMKLHFYVFDTEGTMMYSTTLEPGAKKTVEVLQKGVYTYDVFCKDEGVEQGKITVF